MRREPLSRESYLPCDGPHEGDEFTGDRRDRHVRVLAARHEPTSPLAQAHLGLPGDVLDVLRQSLEPLLHRLGDFGGMAVGPGAFDEHAAGVAVASLGDRALPAGGAAGVLGGDEADEGGELARRVEAREIAQLRDDGDGDGVLHTPQGLQRLDKRPEAPGGDVVAEFGFESVQAVGGLGAGAQGLLEDDLLGRGGAHHAGEGPAGARRSSRHGPRSAGPTVAGRTSAGVWQP